MQCKPTLFIESPMCFIALKENAIEEVEESEQVHYLTRKQKFIQRQLQYLIRQSKKMSKLHRIKLEDGSVILAKLLNFNDSEGLLELEVSAKLKVMPSNVIDKIYS